VRVRTVLDREATVGGLDAAVDEMATDIHPRDTFVFFAAGHGYSHQGRFLSLDTVSNGRIRNCSRFLSQEKRWRPSHILIAKSWHEICPTPFSTATQKASTKLSGQGVRQNFFLSSPFLLFDRARRLSLAPTAGMLNAVERRSRQ